MEASVRQPFHWLTEVFYYKKQTIKVWFSNEIHLIAGFIFLKLLFTTAGQLVSGFEDTYKKQITQSYNRVVEIG